MHYYKFNIADWSLGTGHLSLEEEAIYFRLINHYYDTEKPIPLETQSVFRRLRMDSNSVTALSVLGEFFEKTEKGFVHARCEEMLKEYRKTAKKNRENGKKGGRPRKDGAPKQTQKKPSGFPVGTQTEPKHNPNQEPRTKNHKPRTSKNNKAPSEPINYESWPNEASPEVLKAWLLKRKEVKASLSQLAMNTIGKELHIAVANGFTVDECLCEAEAGGWKGFKAAWMERSRRGSRTGQRSPQQDQEMDDWINGKTQGMFDQPEKTIEGEVVGRG